MIESSIYNELLLIKRNVRDIAMLKVKNTELELVKENATHLGVNVFIEHEYEENLHIVIYKEAYTIDLYRFFKTIPGSNPLRHWGLGHLLGYGRHEIDEFIKSITNV